MIAKFGAGRRRSSAALPRLPHLRINRRNMQPLLFVIDIIPFTCGLHRSRLTKGMKEDVEIDF